ncbi:MAG: hypothetical protein QOI24_3317 [Acidobacteriota bacterium]|jgi:tetratricopeptide (TPR) repeat protein|nr:hypothetical protein [Acidobacteriota bacterium]
MFRRSWRALLVLLPLLALPAFAAEPEIRPISEMERSAVQDVAAYLSGGPQAIYDQLATKSPLRTLSRNDALQEIEVRFGPPSGATWELQTVVPALKDRTAVFNVSYPSGLDESVTLDFVQENGAYRINDLRILAETSPTPQIFPAERIAGQTDGAAKPFDTTGISLALGLMAMLLSGSAAFLIVTHRKPALLMAIAAVLLIAVGGTVAFLRDPRFDFRARASLASMDGRAKSPVLRLASLLPLRRAMTAGNGGVDTSFRQVAIRGICREVAELWKAQADLQQLRTAEVASVLRRFPSPSDVPLVEILRGRLAFAEGNEVDTVVAYEHAANLGPGRDGLWLEAAQALSTLGFTERSEQYLKRLERIGSREANVYYDAALLSSIKNREEATEASLKKAWNLRPTERGDLIHAGAFWTLLRKASFTDVISMSSAAEATFAAPEMATRPLSLPAGAAPRVSGNYLQITFGQQELGVPGGASLAPAGTPIVDAGVWNRSEEEKALAEFEQLLVSAASPGAFTQPLLRRRFERCANALANHNRWADVVRLTDGLTPKSENVPIDLLFVRDLALQRTNRAADAKQLLAELAVSRVMQRKNDPASMERLGEMLASVDLYDAAIKLLEKSASIRQNAMIDDRIRQILMNKRLATRYATYHSPHFEIHYPEEVSANFATQASSVLEAELQRLQQWVPVANFEPVVVNMLWWDDFRSTYTGSDFILGFYQAKKITLPLVGARSFSPPVVALMSHELCHAMIAQATNDQAPHWFHEGLAQRIEMVPYQANAFNMYDDNRLLSISLIDDIVTGSPDPDMIGEAYIESQTIIRFVEAEYGAAGVAKLIAAFRDGATTDEAIARLAGSSVADFDTKLRAWGRNGRKVFENDDITRYDTTELVRRDM